MAAGGALTFAIVFIGYWVWELTVGINTGARLPEALSTAFFAAIGGTLLGVLFSAVRDDGEDNDADEAARDGRSGTASRTG
jgi:membrane associated rhomboid family serine protease